MESIILIASGAIYEYAGLVSAELVREMRRIVQRNEGLLVLHVHSIDRRFHRDQLLYSRMKHSSEEEGNPLYQTLLLGK